MEKTQNAAEKSQERIVRILSTDIEGSVKIYAGLTKIKGISWSFANALCKILKIDKNRKIGSLTEKEVKEISEFARNPELPPYLLNRRKDFEDGKDRHLIGTDLELKKDFDIKRLKKIRGYRGLRHAANLPVRGQRTRSHFRRARKKGSGIKKKVVTKKPEGDRK